VIYVKEAKNRMARVFPIRWVYRLIIICCFAGFFPQELKGNDSNEVTLNLSNRYLFLPDISTITQTSGVAGVNRQYTVKGQFQLYIDFQANFALFAQVDANAIDDSPIRRTLNPDEVFGMTTKLNGVVITDTQILFSGRVADGSMVSIAVTIKDDLIYLSGQTTPPPNSADFFIYKIDAVAARKYSGGLGGDPPYKIATIQDLFELSGEPNDYDKNFIMTADVNLAEYIFDNALIAPYHDVNSGLDVTPFSGTFNGDGHKISNLRIIGKKRIILGLFGIINSGTISSLGLEMVDVNGTEDWTGGLAGWFYSGIITSCYSTGMVIGEDGVGGLVGYNLAGSIVSCYSTCNVIGYGSVGGLAGDSFCSIISCFSSGAVTGDSAVGGLVGMNWHDGSITKSYSTSTVVGNSAVGGLVGFNGHGFINSSFSKGMVFGSNSGWDIGGLVGYNDGSIIYCYSTSPVTGWPYVGGLVGSNGGNIASSYSAGPVIGTRHTGGLIGMNYNINKTTLSFWDSETSGQLISDGGTGKTTTEMKTEATFLDAGWDFIGETQNGDQDIWWIVEANRGQSNPTYPRLWWEKIPEN
jgi:hypothetical protein